MTIDEFEEYAKSHNILIMTREFYENRLKADLITILVALQLQFASRHCKDMRDCWWLIEDKINALKAESEAEDDKS